MELFNEVYSIYLKYKDREILYLIPLVLLSLAVRLRYYFKMLFSEKGFPDSADAQWYLDYAHGLLEDFRIGLHLNDILYMGYNFLLALLLAVFRNTDIILFIQTFTAAVSVILVYQIARMLFNRRTAIIASLIYCISWDITLWTTYILTDSFFISLLLLCVYFLLKYMRDHRRVDKILFILTAFYMVIFRPTGIVSLSFIVIYIIMNIPRPTLVDFFKKHRWSIGGFLIAGIAAFVYLISANILDPFITSLQYNAKLVLYNVYGSGWIYDIPSPHDVVYVPDYNINILNSLILSFIINNWDHISLLYLKRTVAFLGRWVWMTDIRSISGIFKFLVHALVTAFFFIGLIAAIVNKTFRKASIVWLVVLAVYIFCIVLFIDGLYRYRAPGIPFIAIAVAYGADRVIDGAIRIANNYTGKLPWNKGKY